MKVSRLNLKLLAGALFLATGGILATASPAFACHHSTGWCCTDGSDNCNTCFCCYFEGDQIQAETCG